MPLRHVRWFAWNSFVLGTCADGITSEQEGRREGWGQVRLGEGICPALSVFDATFFACILWAGYLNG